ncbi:sulfurtransferase TusA family protein [Nitrospina watsonii]|uniref:Ferredoxin--sulfite reductase n=1 Tax=Nitrospina watsonii TaxID=1323948 RepID=A0ABN8VY43_9BACT|nr:sulfurtransferase TusA family protein [Nitrospina watsonii]CAI2718116.1 Ferredoxin--sulfite reductase [Nitrospina watsonii]
MDLKSLDIPPEVRQELEDFAAEVERLEKGEVSEEEFKRFRLQHGIYGQRQPGQVQMIRTKLPLGRYSTEQMIALADFADKYSNKVLHVTTRQDIQFHFVALEDVPQGLQDLAAHGITTREACGNTVRNVTACHKAGTCKEETFDVLPYARAVSRFLLRHPLTQNLPRKFKISVGGCNGCGLSPIHDIGLNGVVREGQRGFRMVIGGGLGSSPRLARHFSDFVAAEDLLRTCEAVIRVFDQHGDKKNRNKARFKYVLDKYGVDKTRALVEEQFQKLEGKTFPAIDVPGESIPAIRDFTPNRDFDNDPDFKNWVQRNTSPQRQDGFYNVHIKLQLGDLTSEHARVIAHVVDQVAGGQLVNTVHQNIMIPWVKPDAFGNIFAELKKIGQHKAGTEELKDMTCCPGSETCNLGITHSRGLINQLTEDVENLYTGSNDLDAISIKASGCPNSCGQHHIADIGFSGGAKKVNGVLAPHYEMMLGGRISESGAQFGEHVVKIPAKNVPLATRRTVDAYKRDRKNDESFPQFYDRVGKGYFGELLSDLKELPSITESPQSYVDYHSTEKFTLDDRGQGECAGAVTDMITDHLSEAERALFQSTRAFEKELIADSVRQANRSLALAARALLVTEGMDFEDNLETMSKFESLIVETGIVAETHAGVVERFQKDPESADADFAQGMIDESKALIDECRKAYTKMQTEKSLRIRVTDEIAEQKKKAPSTPGNGSATATAAAVDAKIDLKGVKCPFNYVKTKLKLETMNSGQKLEVLLDDGEPAENVPRSVQNDGHKLVSHVQDNGHHIIVIEKA